MKNLKDLLNESKTDYIFEANKNANVQITPENFNKYHFTDKQAALIKYLLEDYKENTTFIYLVSGDTIPKDPNIKQYFGTLIPEDERGILFIERQSTSNGSPETAIFYDSSKINKSEKTTYVYSYHTNEESKYKSAVLTVDETNSKLELQEKNINH
jgi:hypothetical protein